MVWTGVSNRCGERNAKGADPNPFCGATVNLEAFSDQISKFGGISHQIRESLAGDPLPWLSGHTEAIRMSFERRPHMHLSTCAPLTKI